MQLYSKTIEMANVQWAKVMMKGVVEQTIIDRKVDGRVNGRPSSARGRTLLSTGGAFVG